MNEILSFPKTHPKFDMSDVPLDPVEMQKKLELIRMSFYADIADELLDQVACRIGVLNLNKKNEPALVAAFPKDIMLLREVLIGMMCRFSDIKHPTHDMFEKMYDLTEDFDEESGEVMYNYVKRTVDN
jgi:hypothetical protein